MNLSIPFIKVFEGSLRGTFWKKSPSSHPRVLFAILFELWKDGFKILVGRNNVQNDKLLRLAAQNDIWLHTQKYHSSHVIIVTEGRQVRDEIILYAAELCAHYSEGRGGEKVPVDYCQRKYVKKPNKAKAGFVVYTDYKTVLVKGWPSWAWMTFFLSF